MEDLSNEKAPTRKILIPVGWREQELKSVIYKNSGAGNPMYVFGLFDDQNRYTTNVYAINVPGKRWALKSIMDSCGYKSIDNKYDLSEESVKSTTIGKKIMCLFEHEPNDYINRNGETVKGFQHKIVEFKECEEQEWDKDLK